METTWRYKELPKAQLFSSFPAPWLPWLTSHLNSMLLFFCILGFWQRLLCAGICCNTEPVDWAVFGSHCCDKFLPISPIFQACARPGESRRGAQVGAAWGSIIKQVACTGCESLKAPSSPDSALPIRKALPKGQVQTGTPVLSSYTFLLWGIDKYVKYIFHKLEDNN